MALSGSPLIPQEILDEISSKLDLVSVISDHVTLKKSGKDYKGLCPFHQEKSPSFTVSPDKGIFHCFGCGVGGNLFSFVMKIESMTFPEAIKKLASRAGVALPSKGDPEGDSKYKEQNILYKINQYASWFFAEQIKTSSVAKQYLESRHITEDMVSLYQLGYAPDGWDGLTTFLKTKSVPLEKVAELGLVKTRQDGGSYDFFRNRLMFPIVDAENRIVGFGGRRLNDESKTEA